MDTLQIPILPWSLADRTPQVEAFLRRPAFDERAEAAAAKCLADIRVRGLDAVLDACRAFDQADLTPETIRVTDAELDAADAACDAAVKAAVAQAAERVATFAKAGLFTDWAAGQTYAKGYRLAHKGIVYEVMQEVTSLENQPPDAAGLLAVYRPLSVDPETGEEPDGSREHPFAFLYGMDVTKDSYYSYEGKLWLARADMPACVWVPGTAGLWQWEEASAA